MKSRTSTRDTDEFKNALRRSARVYCIELFGRDDGGGRCQGWPECYWPRSENTYESAARGG
eukprot:5011768-Pyramimonas_sp.AAC.1